MPRYRFNQLAFVDGDARWMRRRGRWHRSAPSVGLEPDAAWTPMDAGFDPIEEGVVANERRVALRGVLADFEEYSRRIGGEPW